MKLQKSYAFLIASALALLPVSNVNAAVIAGWSFEGLSTSGVNASPATSTGAGAASTLGMALFTGPDASGIAAGSGTDTTLTWKVRGTNGWNSGAAIATQGAQFSASTTGYAGVSVSFDWYPSTTGEANLLVQYTLDGTNWVNTSSSQISLPSSASLSVVTNSSSSNTVNGAYIKTTAGNVWYAGITVDFSSVTGASNDASFGVRLVNAATGADDVQATSGGALDNTKGNWSFDNVQISGTASAIPEPSTYAALAGAGALGLAFWRRRNRAA